MGNAVSREGSFGPGDPGAEMSREMAAATGQGDGICARQLFEGLGAELGTLHHDLLSLQHAVSCILSADACRNIEPSRLKELQSLDRLTQTAMCLSALVTSMSKGFPDAPPPRALEEAVFLRDMRDRLLRRATHDDDGEPPIRQGGAEPEADVTWF